MRDIDNKLNETRSGVIIAIAVNVCQRMVFDTLDGKRPSLPEIEERLEEKLTEKLMKYFEECYEGGYQNCKMDNLFSKIESL